MPKKEAWTVCKFKGGGGGGLGKKDRVVILIALSRRGEGLARKEW